MSATLTIIACPFCDDSFARESEAAALALYRAHLDTH